MFTRNKKKKLKAIQFLGSPYPSKGQTKEKEIKQTKKYEKRKNT